MNMQREVSQSIIVALVIHHGQQFIACGLLSKSIQVNVAEVLDHAAYALIRSLCAQVNMHHVVILFDGLPRGSLIFLGEEI